jgi:hypothetical protein
MDKISKLVPFYNMLVYLILFVLIKKFIDVTIQVKYPTFTGINFSKQPIVWKYLLYFSNFLYIFEFLFVLFFIFNYKLDWLILCFLYLLLFKTFYYFLIDYKFIYVFISKDKYSKFIEKIDKYGDTILDATIFLSYVYILYKLLIS